MSKNITGIVGFGLIGGSMAAALKKYTDNIVYAFDNNASVLRYAASRKDMCDAAFDVNDDAVSECDTVFVALYPQDTVNFINSNAGRFKNKAVICDLCGIKSYVINNVNKKLRFIGAHPMAGKEVNGAENADADLYRNASFLMCITPDTDMRAADEIEALAKELGFKKTVRTTPENHDRMITYTSQLAHVISVAYVFQKAFGECDGYYAGSFRDMTRVAKINPVMWSEIFRINRDVLCKQIDEYISSLKDIEKAIKSDDDSLYELLSASRKLKEWQDENYKN